MAKKKDNIAVELERLNALLDRADVPRQQRDALTPVIDNLAWQRIKLDEAREQMRYEDIVCEYDNGGGQTGTRENPFFKAYTNLWRAYMVGLDKFTSYLPTDLQAEVTSESVSILEQVKRMKKAKV